MPRPLAAITGASSGIGETFARKLVPTHDLLLIARRRDKLDALARELGGTSILAVDLASDAGLDEAATRIAGEERLELLVNNAGFGTQGRFWEADFAAQQQMHRLHVTATLRLTRAALGGMVRRGRGGIINVSSVAAFARSSGNVSYCATKAWMNAFTEGLSLELRTAGSPVKVQALCPGFTYTEFHDTMGIDRATISKWLWMRADDVVDASLEGLRNGRPVVIPGRRYRWFVAVFTRLPMRLRTALQSKSPHRR